VALPGENAIVRTAQQVDIITGPLSVSWRNAMMGEVTPLMAASSGRKRGAVNCLLPSARRM
jgi:hypothetical protein